MPNWCSNALVVKGPKKDLDAFKATLDLKGEVPFSFAQTVPPPANMLTGSLSMEDMQKAKDTGIPTWYDWQPTNWGVKWDACEVRVELKDKSVKVWFDTPWAPPLAWFASFAAKFPNLTAELAYNECGMAYYGVAEASEGTVSDNGGDKYEDGDTDEDGNPKGVLKKHMNKYGLGMGG
jgi:hypothetical protein